MTQCSGKIEWEDPLSSRLLLGGSRQERLATHSWVGK